MVDAILAAPRGDHDRVLADVRVARELYGFVLVCGFGYRVVD